ncbi:contactin-3-like isoform X4 [Pecten maximus]|uniref:contactin-3-like isoform X4 n=1 Tax=Pecten maximus TaxID=6579 RepID=UPI001458D2C1|nr:contactin-3-like isoform X4 [Pecten maximus]
MAEVLACQGHMKNIGEWMKTKEQNFLVKHNNQVPVYNKTPRDEDFPNGQPKDCYLCAATDEYLAYIRFLEGFTEGKLDKWWLENLALRKKYKEEIKSPLAKLIPVPRVNKLTTTDKGRGVLIQWEIPNDVSSVIIEGFLIAYRQCGLGSTNQVKLVPGSDVSMHVIAGLQTCTLYELKVAAYIGEGKGRYSIPMIIRTGVQTPETMLIQKSTEPRYVPKIVRMYPVTDPAGIYVKWTPPSQYFGPTIAGYVIAFREAKSPDKCFQTCYIRGINTSFHIIKGVRKGVEYEVKLAAYNPSGDGPFSLAKLVRNSGQRISSIQVKQILKKNKIKLPT